MPTLTTDTLVQACRIFLSLAYTGGIDSAPASRRVCLNLPPGQDLNVPDALQGLPPDMLEVQKHPEGGVRSYALRLGSGHFPHLKLRVHRRIESDGDLWLFAVDTHDAFSRDYRTPPLDHPDAPAWIALQKANANLKEEIERAWAAVGLDTFNTLLRGGL